MLAHIDQYLGFTTNRRQVVVGTACSLRQYSIDIMSVAPFARAFGARANNLLRWQPAETSRFARAFSHFRQTARPRAPTTYSITHQRRTMASMSEPIRTKVCIIGSGPAGHTSAIYTGRAELKPVMFEGFLANGIAAGGQLTTTTDVENFPGFPTGIGGIELTDNMRQQSINCGATIYTETVTDIDLSQRPFVIKSSKRTVEADTVILATGAVAKRLEFPGSGEGPDGFWQRGISACAVCDGAAPIFRNHPLFVIGGGDSAMEEAVFLTKFASKVYIVHRRDELRASKVMQKRAIEHPKIEILYSSEIVAARGESVLKAVDVKDKKTGEVKEMEAAGVFFAIGHTPATEFLNDQVQLDEEGYIVTTPGTTETSVKGVFACGDVQDKKWRQAVTAAGTGCMAALQAEHLISEEEAAQ
eukprot:m.45564 g.45564  ORF g.45564 m.45564 type:complete len:416 (-) comp10887_c1_seq1:234-1481(-)